MRLLKIDSDVHVHKPPLTVHIPEGNLNMIQDNFLRPQLGHYQVPVTGVTCENNFKGQSALISII